MIDHEGHRPIVDQGDLHVGLKNPAFDVHSHRSDLIAKKLVEFSSLFGHRGSIEDPPARTFSEEILEGGEQVFERRRRKQGFRS